MAYAAALSMRHGSSSQSGPAAPSPAVAAALTAREATAAPAARQRGLHEAEPLVENGKRDAGHTEMEDTGMGGLMGLEPTSVAAAIAMMERAAEEEEETEVEEEEEQRFC